MAVFGPNTVHINRALLLELLSFSAYTLLHLDVQLRYIISKIETRELQLRPGKPTSAVDTS